jgi:hypothetical protein
MTDWQKQRSERNARLNASSHYASGKIVPPGVQPDRAAGLAVTLASPAVDQDLLVTSGGVSTGDEDYVRNAIEQLGSLHFWQLAIKPGRPVALGRVGGVPLIGLPSNPVPVVVTFDAIARSLILKLAGATPTSPQLFPVRAGFAHPRNRSGVSIFAPALNTMAPGSSRSNTRTTALEFCPRSRARTGSRSLARRSPVLPPARRRFHAVLRGDWMSGSRPNLPLSADRLPEITSSCDSTMGATTEFTPTADRYRPAVKTERARP